MNCEASPHFYVTHGEWSDPRAHGDSFDCVGKTISAVTSAVQGLLVHDYFGEHLYPEAPPDFGLASRATLPIHERLPALYAFGHSPLAMPRETKRRVVGTCRDFALLTCSMLRHHGIPARVRCGFAYYFHPPTYEDHWICEYWDDEAMVWKMADAQLDGAHVEHLSITFDGNDIPKDQFLFPRQVWEAHRNDISQLDAFGSGESRGFWFVRVNLARDFLALTKREVSAWDTWRDHTNTNKQLTEEAVAQCDQLATAAKSLERTDQVDLGSLGEMVESLRRPYWQT